MRDIRLALCALLLPLLAAGCIFSPKKADKKPPPPPRVYLSHSAPESVLYNLKLAYERKDSVEYKLLFDRDQYPYLGVSIDQKLSETDSLYWDDEARHIARLAQEPTLQVVLSLGDISSWDRETSPYVEDPPGSAMILITQPILEIYHGVNAYLLAGGVTFEYRFAPTTPSPSSPTDTTWHIIRWTEFRPNL